MSGTAPRGGGEPPVLDDECMAAVKGAAKAVLWLET
jgi:hypothetical protein